LRQAGRAVVTRIGRFTVLAPCSEFGITRSVRRRITRSVGSSAYVGLDVAGLRD
jgi:hypothetical protein